MSLSDRVALAGVKARNLTGNGLRKSPAPVQQALRTASRRVLAALAVGDKAKGDDVWQSPEVPVPDGFTVSEIEESFRTWSVNGEPVGHLDGYVEDSSLRFMHTWGIVRNDKGKALELGGNPYFTTELLDRYTDLELTLANYYGENGEMTETVSYVPPGETKRVEIERKCVLFNVEEDVFPYADNSFDVVLFCEMLEHMLMDPMHTLREIHRVLKPGAVIVLTTPNVARLNNVMALVNGANIYDPYSGYGPYGRHNREFTRHELHRLLEFAGFEVEYSLTADGHPTNNSHWPQYSEVAPLLRYRHGDLGHYLMVRAKKARPPREGLPSFLYRSRPAGEIVDYT